VERQLEQAHVEAGAQPAADDERALLEPERAAAPAVHEDGDRARMASIRGAAAVQPRVRGQVLAPAQVLVGVLAEEGPVLRWERQLDDAAALGAVAEGAAGD